ncbi:hypothetical protein [Pseudoxanthomonas sp. PXM02]|uniref:hypothetical protein n=1 Tax=Pseudoxanthomonas sp. PXM02 TaxID=2769294 RepID=UPI00177F5798|nr:hypothetical protein [Pseudoxanthomonas sp. PXM02]MBD9478984.1 hypothetical protein [Pseudoxanthomonas sp. PXM02]
MRVTLVACAVALTGIAYLLGRSALKILRSGQVPAPDTSVLFRTRVYTGWWARANGIAWLLIAILPTGILIGMLDMFVFSEVGAYMFGLRDCDA